MPKLKPCRPVDAEYPQQGPNAKTLRQPLAAPAERVFQCLEDGPAWKEWLGVEVEWTSPQPHRVGTTRTVRANRQVIEEYFLLWEQGRRFTFRFDRSTLPVAAFAEDYLVESTGDRTSALLWSYAFEMRGPFSAVTARLFGKLFEMNARRALLKLADLVVD